MDGRWADDLNTVVMFRRFYKTLNIKICLFI